MGEISCVYFATTSYCHQIDSRALGSFMQEIFCVRLNSLGHFLEDVGDLVSPTTLLLSFFKALAAVIDSWSFFKRSLINICSANCLLYSASSYSRSRMRLTSRGSRTPSGHPASFRRSLLEKPECSQVIVFLFSRFVRSVGHLLKALQKFKEKNVRFVSTTEQLDRNSPMGPIHDTWRTGPDGARDQ